MEKELPSVGRVIFEDSETGETKLINTSDKRFQSQYKTYTKEIQESFARQLRRRGIDNFEFSTSSDYAKTLQEFFNTRGNRIKR